MKIHKLRHDRLSDTMFIGDFAGFSAEMSKLQYVLLKPDNHTIYMNVNGIPINRDISTPVRGNRGNKEAIIPIPVTKL